MGESVCAWFAVINCDEYEFGEAGRDASGRLVGSGLDGGGLKTDNGRVTDCTTWGLSVALVARAVTLTPSSGDG
jgi:hypothetical protein